MSTSATSRFLAALSGAALIACSGESPPPADVHGWDENGRLLLRSLWIESLPALPPSKSNRVADDPRAAELGHRLFFDPALSANGETGNGRRTRTTAPSAC